MERLQQVLKNQGGNYIMPFFWQHGEDEETLRHYMHAIHDANIGAVCVESRPHPEFAGERWWKDMDVILGEAKRLGMKVWILDDSHFPTGYANGAVKEAPLRLRHQYLCYRTLEMAGPVEGAEFEVRQYMRPAPPPPWIPHSAVSEDFSDAKLVKILAYPVLEKGRLGEPEDLTQCVENGTVVFDLPDGYYRIFVVYATRHGRGRNDYINLLDRDSCRLLIDAVYEPHYAHYKEYFGNVIAGFFSDEPPVGNVEGYEPVGPVGEPGRDLPWAGAAAAGMRKEFGSDRWMLYLGYLWADAADVTMQAKLRIAYMNMVTGLISECFSDQIGSWCEEHGVEYIGHMLEDCDMNMSLGASMGHFFRGLSGQHMAGIDNIGGQVGLHAQNALRHEHPVCEDEAGFYHYVLGKLGASHAAIDPRKRGRTLCENFGAYGWQSGPAEQKYLMDHFLARGVNRYVPHAFSPAPFPDPDCPPHFYAHGENPTYRAFGDLMAYANRVCHLIDGGVPCPDVAVLYAAEGVWTGAGDSNIPVCRALSESQVDFHILPADVFLTRGVYPTCFDGERLMVNGVVYRALVISGCAFLDAATANFILQAAGTNFPVLFADQRPQGITGAEEAENMVFAKAAADCPVVPASGMGDYLRQHTQLPLLVAAQPGSERLTSYRYRIDNCDELLLLNEEVSRAYEGEIFVRAQGVPVKYDPWENRVETVEYESMEHGVQRLRVRMEPLELFVLLFLTEQEVREISLHGKQRQWKESVKIDGFTVGRVAAVEYLAQLRLANAPMHGAGAVVKPKETKFVCAPFTGMQKMDPEFSGYYIYETELELDDGKDYMLQIDRAAEAAEVFLDGVSVGVRVQAPYHYYLPKSMVQGAHHILRIEVATLAERRVKALGAPVAAMGAERPFSPTGILGKVTVYECVR